MFLISRNDHKQYNYKKPYFTHYFRMYKFIVQHKHCNSVYIVITKHLLTWPSVARCFEKQSSVGFCSMFMHANHFKAFFVFLFDKVHKMLSHANLSAFVFMIRVVHIFEYLVSDHFYCWTINQNLIYGVYICYLMSNRKFTFLNKRRLNKENSSYANNLINNN